jgi:CRISPR-associated exonuclease Cas4
MPATAPRSSDLGDWREPVLAFRELAEAHDLHGLLFQHVELCHRRAWLHANRIDYSHLEPRMSLGTTSHALSKVRDTSVEGLIGLAPDRIDWKAFEVIEAKGSAGARRAVSFQTLFYAIMLMASTGRRWSASNEILGSRKRIEVPVNLDGILRMLAMARDLASLRAEEAAPPATKKSICASCSYRFLCGFS